MMGGSGLTAEEEVNSARQMFNYGCFGLPWLWVINVAYFRKSQEPEIIKCESALFAPRSLCTHQNQTRLSFNSQTHARALPPHASPSAANTQHSTQTCACPPSVRW